jgi:lipoprotein-anchoring transpeptidase ErfK/SrfK
MKILPTTLQAEIQDGFFELKQKYRDVTNAVYISHHTLHEKHPVFSKLKLVTLKKLLKESTIVNLVEGQVLYKIDAEDLNVYFVLFGKVSLYTKSEVKIGKATLGWTIGEEVLFDASM